MVGNKAVVGRRVHKIRLPVVELARLHYDMSIFVHRFVKVNNVISTF